MDKRTLLAFALMALVIVVTPILFPGPKRTPATPATDTAKTAAGAARPTNVEAPTPTVVQPAPAAPATTRTAVADTITVNEPTMRLTLSSAGAAPTTVQLKGYRD